MPNDPTTTAVLRCEACSLNLEPDHSCPTLRQPATAACPYCGLTDHTGREHLQFVVALSDPKGGDDDD